jgi:hypothetical protein
MTSRVGKAAHDIFASTTAPPATTSTRSNPQHQREVPYVKATVVLRNDQVAKLDRLCVDARGKSGAVLARAELIRAMVDAVLGSNLDLTVATSEEDLRAMLARAIKA